MLAARRPCHSVDASRPAWPAFASALLSRNVSNTSPHRFCFARAAEQRLECSPAPHHEGPTGRFVPYRCHPFSRPAETGLSTPRWHLFGTKPMPAGADALAVAKGERCGWGRGLLCDGRRAADPARSRSWEIVVAALAPLSSLDRVAESPGGAVIGVSGGRRQARLGVNDIPRSYRCHPFSRPAETVLSTPRWHLYGTKPTPAGVDAGADAVAVANGERCGWGRGLLCDGDRRGRTGVVKRDLRHFE